MEENVDIVRRWAETMTAGTEATQAAMVELWDPEADFCQSAKFPDGACHGQQEISEWLAGFHSSFARQERTVDDVIAVDDVRVRGKLRIRAEGRASGVELDDEVYVSAWFRFGRILRWEGHLTLRGALLGLGLEGETLEAGLAR